MGCLGARRARLLYHDDAACRRRLIRLRDARPARARERLRRSGSSVYHPAREVSGGRERSSQPRLRAGRGRPQRPVAARGEHPMSLRALIQRPMPVTAPLVLNPLMARMAEAAGFPAGYLGGGSTGYRQPRVQDRRRSLHPAAGGRCGVEKGLRGAGRRVRRQREDETGLEPGGKGHVDRHRSRETPGDRARDRRGRHAMTAVRTTRG